jgi:hypothetical protein
VVAVTAVPSVAVLEALVRLRRAGRRVALVAVGDQALESTVAVPVYRVPSSASWSSGDALPLIETLSGAPR